MDNFNIDKNTMDKLNSMLGNGNLNDMLSKIPPDALQKFSNMMQSNVTSNPSTEKSASNTSQQDTPNCSDTSSTSSNFNQFDMSSIDINTMMKIKSVMEKMNHSSDPRSNLLQSLKPYLRDEKKSKLDQYANLLNMTSLIELFNQNNSKENSSDK